MQKKNIAMNKILAAISIVFAAGLLFAVPPNAFANRAACTPGYWKNNTDTNGFGDLDDDELRASVLGLTGFDLGEDAEITLAEAVSLKGGGQNAVFRYAAAEVYNTEAFGADFPDNLFVDALERFDDGNISGAIKRFEKLHDESICTIDAFGQPI